MGGGITLTKQRPGPHFIYEGLIVWGPKNKSNPKRVKRLETRKKTTDMKKKKRKKPFAKMRPGAVRSEQASSM